MIYLACIIMALAPLPNKDFHREHEVNREVRTLYNQLNPGYRQFDKNGDGVLSDSEEVEYEIAMEEMD